MVNSETAKEILTLELHRMSMVAKVLSGEARLCALDCKICRDSNRISNDNALDRQENVV